MGLPLIVVMRARIIGKSFGVAQPALLDELHELAGLCCRDVDHEEIRRVRRQARAPVLEQVVPHDREQQQHHQPEAEGDHLHDALATAPREVRHAIAPGDAHRAAQAPGERDEHEAGAIEHGERDPDACRDVCRRASRRAPASTARRPAPRSRARRRRSSAAAGARGSAAARARAARASAAASAAAQSRPGSRAPSPRPVSAGASVGGGRSTAHQVAAAGASGAPARASRAPRRPARR